MKKHKKIPRFKSDKKAAAFWDAHDFTEYLEDTEPAEDVVFEKPQKETISLRLEKSQIRELKRIAHKVGLGYTSLIRIWVIEKLSERPGLGAVRHK